MKRIAFLRLFLIMITSTFLLVGCTMNVQVSPQAGRPTPSLTTAATSSSREPVYGYLPFRMNIISGSARTVDFDLYRYDDLNKDK